MTTLEKAFALQAAWAVPLGSPFMAALLQRCGQDLETGGPVKALMADWHEGSGRDPLADAACLRLTGALHAAALSNRDPALAAEYPAQREDWSMERIWPLARAFMTREPEWIGRFLQSAPQTNETRRTIALLPGFLECARFGPLHLLEIGASAGLNQLWDRFRFKTESWAWGTGDGPLMDTNWAGPPPAHLDASVHVASRSGCDLNPLDVRDPEQRLRLKSYVWPDQPDRLARIDAAIALADGAQPPDSADAGDWLARKLAGPLPEGVTVIFHSVVWQYLPAATKAAAEAAIAASAARADDAHRLAWLRYEPNPILDHDGPKEGMGVDLQIWPNAEPHAGPRRLCDVDGHARHVNYRA